MEKPPESKIDARNFGLWFGRRVDEIIFGGIFWLADNSMFIYDEWADALRIVFLVPREPFGMAIPFGNSTLIFDELPEALRIFAREPVATATFAGDTDRIFRLADNSMLIFDEWADALRIVFFVP